MKTATHTAAAAETTARILSNVIPVEITTARDTYYVTAYGDGTYRVDAKKHGKSVTVLIDGDSALCDCGGHHGEPCAHIDLVDEARSRTAARKAA